MISETYIWLSHKQNDVLSIYWSLSEDEGRIPLDVFFKESKDGMSRHLAMQYSEKLAEFARELADYANSEEL